MQSQLSDVLWVFEKNDYSLVWKLQVLYISIKSSLLIILLNSSVSYFNLSV